MYGKDLSIARYNQRQAMLKRKIFSQASKDKDSDSINELYEKHKKRYKKLMNKGIPDSYEIQSFSKTSCFSQSKYLLHLKESLKNNL